MTTEPEFALLGHPVAHSLSPVIHGAAYAALGISARYCLVDCPDEAAVRVQIGRLARGELAGLNVTVPWKRTAFEEANRLSATAERTQVANVLALVSGEVWAHNTDALALEQELAELARGVTGPAWVLGSGGAAQASVVALRALGYSDVRVTSRSWTSEIDQGSWARSAVFSKLGATVWPWRCTSELRGAVLVVQATSAGMHGADPGASVSEWIAWRELSPHACVYDVVYTPAETPFLVQARSCGVRAVGGLGMLVRQAAAAIEIWLGTAPPLAPMMEAARRALALRGRL